MEQEHLIFCYGTLMAGFQNHFNTRLNESLSLGRAFTVREGSMYCDMIPIVNFDTAKSGKIAGELFLVK